jgi:hypothetical protein
MSGPDPWGSGPAGASVSPGPAQDPFSPASPSHGNGQDLLAGAWGGEVSNGASPAHQPGAAANPWDLSGLDPMAGNGQQQNTGARPKKIVESLLGEHSNLVNLDNLTQVLLLTPPIHPTTSRRSLPMCPPKIRSPTSPPTPSR